MLSNQPLAWVYGLPVVLDPEMPANQIRIKTRGEFEAWREKMPKGEPMEWQDIATAPKDGTFVLLWWPHWSRHPVAGRFICNEWDAPCRLEGRDDPPPTHWMPLPAPPTVRGADDGE